MIRYWIEMHFAGVPISFGETVGMALRRTLRRDTVSAIVASHLAKLGISRVTLEAHTLAGGRADEVVTAAIQLDQMGQRSDPEMLCAIDLKSGNLRELVDAYKRSRELHPEFAFAEFAKRYLDGEEVLVASAEGKLAPLALAAGWQVRVEYGPLSTPALGELLDRMKGDTKVTVLRPGSDRWEPASRIRDLFNS
jgi:hypothetical protein